MKKLLVTGGCGFIGSNFIRYILQNTDYVVYNLDALTYAGNPENLADLVGTSGNDEKYRSRYHFIHGSIQNSEIVRLAFTQAQPDVVLNFAAESHVDRSVMSARPFVETNVLGTLTLLEAAREFSLPRFVQISTDEVYGSLGETGLFTENSPITPNSPYSSSKASSDLLVRAFHETHGMNAVITRCSNNYGPYQFPEKLIPLMVLNALEGKQLPVYGDGKNVRDWLHVVDHCTAILAVMERGKSGEVYNIGGECERENISIVREILHLTHANESQIRYVTDRPGHDRRYAIDCTKIKQELGWKQSVNFEQGLFETVEWIKNNAVWCERVRSGAYRSYYEMLYSSRLA